MLLNKKTFLNWIKSQPSSGSYLGWRIASIITVGAMVLSAFASAWFIYYNIYTTLTNAAGIIILEATPHLDSIDTVSFEQAQKNLLSKSAVIKWPGDLRDIFDYKN